MTMNADNEKRCPHYQLYSEPLGMEGTPAYLAIRRCLLTERQIPLLRGAPDGKALADKMVVRLNSEKTYAFVGPDLDAVTQHACTVQRCEERCTPAYVHHLEHFDLDDPGIDKVVCEENEGKNDLQKKDVEKPASCTQT